MRIDATEAEIEDVLCNHLDRYLGLRFIARQISTPAGVVDVLARCPKQKIYYVIELKKDKICSSAYAQVMRYANYFNLNRSSEGRRLFFPMLIGANLADDILRNVEYYEQADADPARLFIPKYRLFNFDPLEGVSFSYARNDASEYERKYLYGYTKLDYLIEDADARLYHADKKIAELQEKIRAMGVDHGELV